MSPRTIMRRLNNTIRHVPESGMTFEIFCVAYQCGEESGGLDDGDAALDWALNHKGRTGHDLFRRVATDHARVTEG